MLSTQTWLKLRFALVGVALAGQLPLLAQADADATRHVAPAFSKSFMPDNDLWMEDDLFTTSQTSVSQEMFMKLIQAAKQVYAREAAARRERLVINARWSDSTVNARCGRRNGIVTVDMYGGMARRPEINIEGFTVVLCHELGHAYGGAPYMSPFTQLSAEGQADYYSTLNCFNRMAAVVPELNRDPRQSDFADTACRKYTNQAQYASCIGKLGGALGLGEILAAMSGKPVPQYETPDRTVVSRTVLTYPATIQCRLDTYLAGAMGVPRPACWFRN